MSGDCRMLLTIFISFLSELYMYTSKFFPLDGIHCTLSQLEVNAINHLSSTASSLGSFESRSQVPILEWGEPGNFSWFTKFVHFSLALRFPFQNENMPILKFWYCFFPREHDAISKQPKQKCNVLHILTNYTFNSWYAWYSPPIPVARYSGAPLNQTLLGPLLCTHNTEVSVFQGFSVYFRWV